MDDTTREEIEKAREDVVSIFSNIEGVKGALYAEWLKNIYNMSVIQILVNTQLIAGGKGEHVNMLNPWYERNLFEIVDKAIHHIALVMNQEPEKVKNDFSNDMIAILVRAGETSIYPIIGKGKKSETDSTGSGSPGSSSG